MSKNKKSNSNKSVIQNKKFKSRNLAGKNSNQSVIGNIYFVHPSHVIKKSEMSTYIRKKGNANKRPIAITSEKKPNSKTDKRVGVSKIYGTPGKSKQVQRGNRTLLSETKMNKKSWISSDELNKSFKTGKDFEYGSPPLINRRGKVHPNDLRRRQTNKQKESNK